MAYLQAFDVPEDQVVLGTTLPVLSYAVAATDARLIRPRRPLGAGVQSYAVTSSRTGGAGPAAACSVSMRMSGVPEDAADVPLPAPMWAPRMVDLYDPITAQAGVDTGTAYLSTFDARRFDPVADRVVYTTSPYDWSGGAASFSAWVRFDDVAATERRWYLGQTGGGAFAIFIGSLTTGNIRFWHQHGTTSLSRTTAAATVVPDVWYHVVVTYPGNSVAGDVHIYVNGVQPGYVTTTNGVGAPTATTGAWSLGYALSASVSMLGEIAFPMAFATILTPAQVAAIYESQRGTFGV
ncbi:MAG: LamG domain-containing protein [Myxococcales bacterium]|nr:LamG domain-containing protein [Myxococcales bacterium]